MLLLKQRLHPDYLSRGLANDFSVIVISQDLVVEYFSLYDVSSFLSVSLPPLLVCCFSGHRVDIIQDGFDCLAIRSIGFARGAASNIR